MFKVLKGLADHWRGKCDRDHKKLSDELEKLTAENEALLPFKEIAQSRITAAQVAQVRLEACERANERFELRLSESAAINASLEKELEAKQQIVTDMNKHMADTFSNSMKEDREIKEQLIAQDKLITKQRDLIFEYEREKEYYEAEFNKKKRRGRPKGS